MSEKELALLLLHQLANQWLGLDKTMWSHGADFDAWIDARRSRDAISELIVQEVIIMAKKGLLPPIPPKGGAK